jgi:hypothetical protein
METFGDAFRSEIGEIEVDFLFSKRVRVRLTGPQWSPAGHEVAAEVLTAYLAPLLGADRRSKRSSRSDKVLSDNSQGDPWLGRP